MSESQDERTYRYKEDDGKVVFHQLSSIWSRKKEGKHKRNRTAFRRCQTITSDRDRLAENLQRSSTEIEKEDHIHIALIALDSQLSSAIDYIHESNNIWL